MPPDLSVALRLIAITDDLRDGRDGLVARACAAVRGGATMVQLRLKHADARTLADVARALVRTISVPVLVNDRADVALASGAAGTHVGTDDLSVAALRRIVPAGFLIGVSVGSEPEAATARGADYAGIGPLYGSASKLDAGVAIGVGGFARLAAAAGLPAVAIGGISAVTAGAAIAAGAAGIAVIAAVFGRDDPERAARELRTQIDAAFVARALPRSPPATAPSPAG